MQRRPRPGRRAPTTRDTFDDAWCPYEFPLSCWTATTKAPRAHAAATEGPSHCAAHSATSQGALPREIHLRRLRRARGLQLEVRPRPLADDFRRQHLGEAADVRVVAVHGIVVVLAGDGDAVLGPLELVLERPEVLVRLELRVALRDGEQAAERCGQRGIRLGHLLQVATLHRPRELGPRLRYLGEHRLLLLGVAFHRLDQVGDEIGAPLQLHLDLGLGGAHLLVIGLDGVVAAAPADQRYQRRRVPMYSLVHESVAPCGSASETRGSALPVNGRAQAASAAGPSRGFSRETGHRTYRSPLTNSATRATAARYAAARGSPGASLSCPTPRACASSGASRSGANPTRAPASRTNASGGTGGVLPAKRSVARSIVKNPAALPTITCASCFGSPRNAAYAWRRDRKSVV